MRHVAIVGAGWAGLSAAVTLVDRGVKASVYEMAARPGGRARRVSAGGQAFDNGQHILIGAYTQTLGMMRRIGVAPEQHLLRLPLTLRDPDGQGLALPAGPALPAFLRAVLGCRGWSWRDRLGLLSATAGWARRGFRCDPQLSVAALCKDLSATVRASLIDPLCVAALNTPAREASAAVLLRVLKDALFSGPGSADLLLPTATLDELLPEPAWTWLEHRGASLQATHRVETLLEQGPHWCLDGVPFDAVVLACGARESARLTARLAPQWSAVAAGLHFEPIVTVYLDAPGARLSAPMLALAADDTHRPAQFVFDHGALGGPSGRMAFVVSGAAPWLARGREAIAAAVLVQAADAFPAGTWPRPLRVLQVVAEKRATFRCTPALVRPPCEIHPGLWAAGDHVEGPYPATLEGAVRSGIAAAQAAAM